MPQGTHPDRELMDLGIRISNFTRRPGERRTLKEIAAIVNATIEVFSGKRKSTVSRQAISEIEQKGLRKLRVALRFRKDQRLSEAIQHFCGK